MPAGMDYRVERRVGYLTFNRPDKMNSIGEEFLSDIASVMDEVRADEHLRALVLTGSGKAFCVGLDLDLLERAFGDVEYFETVLRRLNAFYLGMEELPIPVVAAVNGIARAGGYEISLAADLVLVADEARIGDVHSPFGVPPGGGASHRLTRRVGEQRAKELIFTGRWLDGREAATWGLALRSVPLGQLVEATEELVDQLRDKPRSCLSVGKWCLHENRHLPSRAAVDVELGAFHEWLTTVRDPGEGMRAFVEHREPVFD